MNRQVLCECCRTLINTPEPQPDAENPIEKLQREGRLFIKPCRHLGRTAYYCSKTCMQAAPRRRPT